MGMAKRLAKGYNEKRKSKKLLSKYTKKEIKICSKATGKICAVNERRLLGIENNALGESQVTFIASIPELEAMIKSAKKTIKTLFKNSNDGCCVRHLNEEVSILLFNKKVG